MKIAFIAALLLTASCGQKSETNSSVDSLAGVSSDVTVSNKSEERNVKFMWREGESGEIKIDLNLCKTITVAEKAALGYVATYIGSDCDWDGEAKEDFSNLKCLIITALGLGYQCSEAHLGFLREAFKNDPPTIERLKDCPAIPFTATSQSTFNEINLSAQGDTIKVRFKANAVNLRLGEATDWSEENIFVSINGGLRLVSAIQTDKKESKF